MFGIFYVIITIKISERAILIKKVNFNFGLEEF